MPFYLLQEDGGKLALEDLSGFLLLEDSPPDVAVVLVGGDDATKKRKKRRNRTKELYDAMERTIHELVSGVVPTPIRVEGGTLVLEAGDEEITLRQLTSLVRETASVRHRITELREALVAYATRKREQDDEDEAEFLLLMS